MQHNDMNDITINEVLLAVKYGFDESGKQFGVVNDRIDSLTISVDGLAQEVKNLKDEFRIHQNRLTIVEQKLDIIPS